MAFAIRRTYGRRTRAVDDAPTRTGVTAARGRSAIGSLLLALSRLVRLAVYVVVAVIVAAIVLRLFSANPGNSIVRAIHDAGSTLVGPFRSVFSLDDPKAALAVNWGVAAVVYLVVGSFIASLIARMALPRWRAADTAV
jgi:hypothetical protein